MIIKGENFNRSAFEFNTAIYPLVSSICQPLFTSACIKHFRYMKMFSDYKYLSIGTNLPYLEQYLCNLKEPGKIFEPSRIFASNNTLDVQNTRRYFLWPGHFKQNETDPLYNTLYEFDIWHGFTISKKGSDYVETWSFATSKDQTNISQFYLNNISLLNTFVDLFQEQIALYVNNISDDILAVFEKPFNLCLNESHPTTTCTDRPQKQYYHIHHRSDIDVTLSKREIECLVSISTGKTYKNTARILGISPRTVECHINSIKSKTGLMFKSELTSLLSLKEIMLLSQLL